MCSDFKYCIILVLLVVSCSPARKLEKVMSGRVAMELNVPRQHEETETSEEKTMVIDSIKGSLSDGPIIMNAIKDTETGEMVATDVINASKVTARFRHVAERQGYVSIEFDITVPREMADSRWQLKVYPCMTAAGERFPLDPVFITGRDYREGQLRGYERYRRFLNSIVTDPGEFIKMNQLEIFLQRYFPDTYAMKNDSTFIPEPLAADLFGVTQEEALRHYTKHLKVKLNDRRKSRRERMFDKFVKDPIVSEGVRLDTVLADGSGCTYRYSHTFSCRPRLRKVYVSLDGALYEGGQLRGAIPFKDSLTYYISSLSTLVDKTPRYRMVVLERNVSDNTMAFVDFAKGSSVVDTTLSDNASELGRIRRCIDDVVAKDNLCLDSLIITASCSPEGSFHLNRRLSMERSQMIKRYVSDFVPDEWKNLIRASSLPENWEQLERIVRSDSLLDVDSKRTILSKVDEIKEPDIRESILSKLPEYRYLREKVYPKLRCVRFDFHLHRIGVRKDTIHTTELDTLYMSGVAAMENLDYKSAVKVLKPYRDYNAALALMSADYNHTAMELLEELPADDSRVCYLKAVILARLGLMSESAKYLDLSIAYDPPMAHRANLDPELHELVVQRNKNFNY